MENSKNASLSKLVPVMLCFFVMGFVDLVGIASNYVKADLNLTDQDIEMFLARIRKSLPKSSKAGSMSADELQNYLQSLQKEKS